MARSDYRCAPIAAGQRFGRLTAIERVANNRHRAQQWLFRCDCRTETIKSVRSVRLGLTQSCGCLGLERLAEHRRGEANGSYKHGKTYSPEWNAWRAMIGRCRHPCSSSYDHYGAIGIDYCERWELFENFLADMGPMPDASYTLDRIDNDLRGGAAYCRGNCRWATRSEQAFNRRPRRPNATGFKGVTKRVTKKAGTYYVSAIEKDDRRHHFGPFSAPEPAYAAYLLAAGALYGVLPKDAAAFAAGLLSRGARDLPV